VSSPIASSAGAVASPAGAGTACSAVAPKGCTGTAGATGTITASGAINAPSIGTTGVTAVNIALQTLEVGTGATGATGTINASAAVNAPIHGATGVNTVYLSAQNIQVGTGATGATGSITTSGDLNVGGNTTITGNLTVNGLTTTVNSNTLTVDDKNIELGSASAVSPTGTVTAGSGIITNLSSVTGIIPGSALTALTSAGTITVAGGTTVQSVDSATQITLSAALTGTGGPTAGVTLTITGVTDGLITNKSLTGTFTVLNNQSKLNIDTNKDILKQSEIFKLTLDNKSSFVSVLIKPINKTKVIKVDSKYTSQQCNKCGHTCKENRKTQSLFECIVCSHINNADLNATFNILQRGQSLLKANVNH
jgi:hypothetical protein